MALAADNGDPKEIARAATTYHMPVEGIAARGGYFLKNNVMQESPLPLLNEGFQFVSTDEGRHVTHGLDCSPNSWRGNATGSLHTGASTM